MITTVRNGAPFPDIPHLGDVLPLGSQVSISPSSTGLITKEAPRTWTMQGDLIDPYVFSSTLFLRSAVETTIPPESAESFRWRLRDSALAAAERSGVAMPPVHEMAVEFGAPVPLFTVGGIVSNSWDIKHLPVGSVVYSAHPDKYDLMCVWEIVEGNQPLKRLMGHRAARNNGEPVTIYSMPGSQEPDTYPIADAAAMSRIALRAWRVGKAYKKQQSWCSVFENCLKALGITDVSVSDAGTSFGPGDEVSRDSAASLPEGTLLCWTYRNNHAVSVYIRDDSARNRARTRRVWGWNDTSENSHERMVVVQTPEEPMAWSAQGWALEQMPEGVRFRGRHMREGVVLTTENRHTVETWQHYAIQEWPL